MSGVRRDDDGLVDGALVNGAALDGAALGGAVHGRGRRARRAVGTAVVR
ncbi:hypothetical protein [Micromonospora parathelypteridis]|uniref:Uncharacterized protein n=1 Tax=Micromonospora parathelypteridis TaxID=1839617 RepID=A0A840VVP7_9ACTN|nr:hypothetical protein [Micromonospora parathelypteridis]MBB5476670.1 hypothetical protein [Micromonospora parathelypteridis]